MEKDGGPGEGPRKGAGGLQGKGGEKPEDSASQAPVQRVKDRRAGQGPGREKRAEKKRAEGGERGAASHSLGSHTLPPRTFISDTKEEAKPLREAGAGRPSCIMHFSPCLFSSSVHFLAGVLS